MLFSCKKYTKHFKYTNLALTIFHTYTGDIALSGVSLRFLPVVKFQELRYNVSLIVKEMNDIEKRSILKIQD
uniref:Uncharacterized protein n=1 Tax=Sinocyclocheilus anshuiensis TaxID=1608454 RepID=A0A671RFG2_9TELE